jgi:hypothetical protein
MKSPQICRIAVAALFAAPVVAVAASAAWFDDVPLAGFGADAWMPKYAAFSLDVYRSGESVADLRTADSETRVAANTMRVYGVVEHDFSRDPTSFRSAESRAEGLVGYQPPRRFGIAWQHRLDGMNHFTVSTGHVAAAPLFTSAPVPIDTRTTVSLTSRWQAAYYPRITGSVFVGGESALPESYRALGRRYYGLAVGGELALSRAHTPYVSFQTQRSLSAGDDALVTALDDDRSQIAAGWKWQAQRHLSLQAEASVGYNGGRLRFENPEHTRVFFGTRFDFR